MAKLNRNPSDQHQPKLSRGKKLIVAGSIGAFALGITALGASTANALEFKDTAGTSLGTTGVVVSAQSSAAATPTSEPANSTEVTASAQTPNTVVTPKTVHSVKTAQSTKTVQSVKTANTPNTPQSPKSAVSVVSAPSPVSVD